MVDVNINISTKGARAHRSTTNQLLTISICNHTVYRLWFVRTPKPPPIPAIRGLELEVETYRAQSKLINETLTVKKIERDSAREATRAARDAFKRCKAAFEAKMTEMEPLKEAARSGGATARKIKDELGELDARTIEELNKKIADAKYRIEHESIPLTEEKNLIALVKKLESQRPRLAKIVDSMTVAAEGAGDVARIKAELAGHDDEFKVLRGEKDTQHTILEKYRQQEDVLEKEVDDLFTQRRKMKELGDVAYARLSELKKDQRTQNDEYYNNRRLSRKVRDLLAAGELFEARKLCDQQMEKAHGKLAADGAYRADYFALWEQQRKAPLDSLNDDDEEGRDEENSNKVANKNNNGEGGESKRPRLPSTPPAKKAEALIAAVLEEAKEEFERLRAAAATGTAASSPRPTVANDRMPFGSASGLAESTITTGTTAATTSTVVYEEAIPNSSGGGPSSSKPRKQKKQVVAVKEIHHHQQQLEGGGLLFKQASFEIPDIVTKAKLENGLKDAAAAKAAERERNRMLQEEAEARKQRRQVDKEKKKKQKSTVPPSIDTETAFGGTVEDVVVSASMESVGTGVNGTVAAPSLAKAAATMMAYSSSVGSKSEMLSSRGAFQLKRAMAPKPAARRPAARRSIKVWLKANELLAACLFFGALILISVYLMYL